MLLRKFEAEEYLTILLNETQMSMHNRFFFRNGKKSKNYHQILLHGKSSELLLIRESVKKV